MTPEYEKLFKTPVAHRIVEKRTKIVEQFARSIADSSLQSIPCSPSKDAERKRCFVNVEDRISKMGGSMLTGWIFNEYQNRSISTEAHAIWVAPFGEKKLDITPHDRQPKRVLFLPDKRIEEKRGYTAGEIFLLSDDPRINAIEAFSIELDKIKDEKFIGINKAIDLLPSDLEFVMKKSGVPRDVAEYLWNLELHKNQLNFQKYGTV
tara:strand:- start:1015 stop:1635 length:621 start_codon:yes stop_codon:yes gene_type:complete